MYGKQLLLANMKHFKEMKAKMMIRLVVYC